MRKKDSISYRSYFRHPSLLTTYTVFSLIFLRSSSEKISGTGLPGWRRTWVPASFTYTKREREGEREGERVDITYMALASNITSMMSFFVFLRAVAISSASDDRALSRLNVSSVLSGTPILKVDIRLLK